MYVDKYQQHLIYFKHFVHKLILYKIVVFFVIFTLPFPNSLPQSVCPSVCLGFIKQGCNNLHRHHPFLYVLVFLLVCIKIYFFQILMFVVLKIASSFIVDICHYCSCIFCVYCYILFYFVIPAACFVQSFIFFVITLFLNLDSYRICCWYFLCSFSICGFLKTLFWSFHFFVCLFHYVDNN